MELGSVTSIGNSAFRRCTSLESITIPDSVTNIHTYAFLNNSSLSAINVDENNTVYSSEDGVLFNKEKTKLIFVPMNRNGETYTVPNGVESIEESAFSGCDISCVIIPNSVTSICEYAFNGSNLESISIPDSVTSIGDCAFESCEMLISIVLPNGITTINESVFSYCSSLESITIPGSVTSIGYECFLGCNSLESIVLPNNADVSSAFITDSATQIKYTVDGGGNVKITGATAGTKKISLAIPEKIGGKAVTSIDDSAFSSCTNLESIFIPNNLDIASAGIPDSATKIKYFADTEGNITITKVTIGSGQTSFAIPEKIDGKAVTDIADEALVNCPDVKHTHREKTAATCTEKPVCSICGQGYNEALGHSFTKYVSDNNATCTENGTTPWKYRNTTATAVTLTELTGGKKYDIAVRAYSGSAWSAFTTRDIVNATPLVAGNKPVFSSVTPGVNRAILRWNAVDGAKSYRVYYRVSGTAKWSYKNTTRSAMNLTGLTGGKTYEFVVRAYNGSTWTAYSSADIAKATIKS